MECKECKGTKFTKAGKTYSGKVKVQRWVCVNCRRTTTINPNINVVVLDEVNK